MTRVIIYSAALVAFLAGNYVSYLVEKKYHLANKNLDDSDGNDHLVHLSSNLGFLLHIFLARLFQRHNAHSRPPFLLHQHKLISLTTTPSHLHRLSYQRRLPR